jgi:hypothetical protein
MHKSQISPLAAYSRWGNHTRSDAMILFRDLLIDSTICSHTVLLLGDAPWDVFLIKDVVFPALSVVSDDRGEFI